MQTEDLLDPVAPARRRPAQADDPVLELHRLAERHEIAAERYFVLGDVENGERHRLVAERYREAAAARADRAR